MRKAVKAVITIAVLLLMFTSCQQRYIIPIPPINSGNGSKPSVTVPPEPTIPTIPEENIVTLPDTQEEYSFSEIQAKISSLNGPIKIVGAGEDKTTIKLDNSNEKLTIKDDLILENLSVKGSAPTTGTKDTKIKGITVSKEISDDINIYLDGVTIKDFGHGIDSGCFTKDDFSTGSTTTIYKTNIYITNSTFENCLKGLYINNLGELKVFNSHFMQMGTLSEDSDDRTTRSGSAFDINQFANGGDIVFYNSTFTECGGDGTSGAIKIKVRGGSDETADDIPNKPGSLNSVLIQSCKFNNSGDNDLVLGTQSSGEDKPKSPKNSTYPKTLAADTKIINTPLHIQDESGHGYEIKNNVLIATKTDTEY